MIGSSYMQTMILITVNSQMASVPWGNHRDSVKVLMENKFGAYQISEIGCVWMVIVFFIIVPSKSHCATLDAFKLTGVEGSIRLGYSFTETDLTQVGGTDIKEKRSGMEQEFNINAQAYVFHPNLLEMELGAGFLAGQDKHESNSGTYDSESEYYDFSGRFNFLKNKPYPVSLYYVKSSPKQAVGVADSLNIKSELYGLSSYLRSPLVNSPVTLRFDHTQSKGESSLSVVDDSSDSLFLGIATNIGNVGNGSIGVNKISKTSGSGSHNLPLQVSTNDTESIDWNGKVALGSERNLSISNHLLLSSSEQNVAPSRDRLTFYNHIDWKIDDATETYNTYNFSKNEYDKVESKNQNLVIGSVHRYGEWMTFSASVDTENEVNDGFKRSSSSLNGSAIAQIQVTDRWASSLGYSAFFRSNSQSTNELTISAFDEAHTFSGISSITLTHEYVISGSVSVSNETHSQDYVENIDYIVITVGSETRLERLISGNIADGQTVLISYEYEAGGTFDFDEIYQSFNIRYSLDRRYNFSLFYSTNKQIYQSGIPVHSMKSVQNYRVGMDAQVPINKTADFGWRLEFERRNEDLNPFTRSSFDLNLNSSLPFNAAFLSVNTGYQQVDNELSPNDIRETYLSTNVSARTSLGGRASFEWIYKIDKGRDTPKNSSDAKLRYEWKRGRLAFSLSARHTKEEQGIASRENSIVEAALRRDFR